MASSRGAGERPVALFVPTLGGGGAERVTVNLALGMSEAGERVDLVAASATGVFAQGLPDGVRLVDLRARRTAAALPRLVRYLRSESPRALLSALDHANVVAIAAARLAGYRGQVWVAVHNDLVQGRAVTPRTRALLALLGWAYRRASGVVAISHGVQRSLVEMAGVPESHIRMIYNPVIVPEILQKAQERPDHRFLLEPGPPVVVGVGRLVREKNFALLIEAVAALEERFPVRLLILGEGEERPALSRLVDRLGLRERVDMPGFVGNPYAHLAHADAFVLSSDSEGLPTVLIEAMAIGTPVVSTDCPNGPREILADGAHGRLVPVGDGAALAAAIESSVREGRRPTPSTWLEQFTTAHATGRYLEILGLVPAAPGGSRGDPGAGGEGHAG